VQLTVSTWNINSVRLRIDQVGRFIKERRPDILCLQETKCQRADLAEEAHYVPPGWMAFFSDAKKKGYAGVALYTCKQPDEVLTTLGRREFDDQGRYLEVRFGSLSVISLYVPSGSSGPERQASKDRFLKFFLPKLKAWRASGREYVICGDWNIAHRNIDLKNWRGNRKNSGFLPHERAWLDTVFDQVGWRDGYRALHPTAEGEGYTWWSNRGQAYAKNVGWRIDYQIVTPGLAELARRATVFKDTRFSDHAPLVMDYAD
jgi:exodeoxyribonuclease-3